MKELKNIQQFLQQMTGAYADVVDMELGVIDRDLEVIAGTGFFARKVGTVYREGCMTQKLLLSPEEEFIFINETRGSSLCRDCDDFEHCGVLAFLMCPISYMGLKIGTFSLLALNEKQRQKLLSEQVKLKRFLNNLCNFIAITLNEKEMGMKVKSLANQVKAVIDFVHEGIVAINAEGAITNINQSALTMLDLSEDVVNKHIGDLFTGFNPRNFMLAGAESGSRNYEHEIHYITDDHVELLLYCNITLMYESSRITGAVISFRRGEDLKKLATRIIGEEKKHTFEAIKGTSPEMIEIKKTMKRVANTDSTLLIRGKPVPAKASLPGLCMKKATAAANPLSPSTVLPSRPRCWNRSCSATRKGRLPALARGASRANSRWLMKGRFFWMKSAICRLAPRSSCCRSLKPGAWKGSAGSGPGAWMCVSLPPPTRTWKRS